MRLRPCLARPRIVLAWALLLLAVPAGAADDEEERASLRGVDSIAVVVEGIPPDAERDGLIRSQLETEVESHLRQAGIKVVTSSPFMLYVNIETLKNHLGSYTYSIQLSFEQPVALLRDPRRVQTFAVTWSVGSMGAVSSNLLQEVQAAVTDLVNSFITAYREQNPKK
jgi:hypothetical protein